MTLQQPSSKPGDAANEEAVVFAFYLVPDFAILAFSSALEALRLANRVLGYKAYDWRLVSEDGEPVRASCGISLQTDRCLAAERKSLLGNDRPLMAIICAEENADKHSVRSLEAWLRECRQPRPAPPASRRLRRRLQLRSQAQDPLRPHALRVHLQGMGLSARTLLAQSAPANAGTKHLGSFVTGVTVVTTMDGETSLELPSGSIR